MFGKHAGFTNSFFEKYAFVPPDASVRIANGEVLMLNAHPFPDQDQQLGRFFVFKPTTNSADLARWWYPEAKVQQIFKDARREIPKPIPMPPPPPEPPPDETFRKAAEALSEEYDRLHPLPFWHRRQWQVAGAAILFCAVLYGFFRLAKRP